MSKNPTNFGIRLKKLLAAIKEHTLASTRTQNLPSMPGIVLRLMIHTLVEALQQLEESSAFPLMLIYMLYHL